MELQTAHTINAPAQAVWKLMGEDFGNVADWSDTIISSSMDGPTQAGATRTCELKPTPAASGTIQEHITMYDPENRTFSFDIVTGLPGFMKLVNATWKIEPDGEARTTATNKLIIKVAWYMTPMLPVLRHQFTKTIKDFIPEIEAAARAPRIVEGSAKAG